MVTYTLIWIMEAVFIHILLHRTDSQAEIDLVCKIAKESGAFDAVPCNHWSFGGKGAVELAESVSGAARQHVDFTYLYNLEVSIRYIQ